MRNPFKIDGPAIVSVSGGRTSGYMLHEIVRAHGGALPADVVPVFCNTGKEREETLEFVARMGREWGVNIVWVEYRHTKGVGPSFAVVDFETASRDGEPLEAAITARAGDSGFLPNPVVRYCTIETKILTAIRWIDAAKGWESWTNAIGFRADEPARMAKLRAAIREQREDAAAPLVRAGVARADVLAWWKRHPFDLQLGPDESNCDLCFLKARGLILRAIYAEPSRADWWIRQEARGGKFRNDRPSYAAMKERATRPALFPLEVLDDEPGELSVACHCTD